MGEKNYRVFHRTWWKDNPSWPNGLEPHLGNKALIGFAGNQDQARAMCKAWNAEHDAGRFSDKAEFEEN
jgi:hypothetical protein